MLQNVPWEGAVGCAGEVEILKRSSPGSPMPERALARDTALAFHAIAPVSRGPARRVKLPPSVLPKLTVLTLEVAPAPSSRPAVTALGAGMAPAIPAQVMVQVNPPVEVGDEVRVTTAGRGDPAGHSAAKAFETSVEDASQGMREVVPGATY